MDRDAYFDGWADLHGGYDPRGSALVRWWLSGVYAVAGPLAAARVPPDAVTALGVLVSAVAAGLAAGDGSAWLAGAALVVVVSGLLDNLDGAVAVLRGRPTPWGHLLDSLADRVSDLLYLAALWLAGADARLCAGGGVLMLLQEYTRARAAAGGMTDIGVVTVWERPTRVVVTAAFLGSAATLGGPWAGLGAAAWVGLGVVGQAQLLVVARRRLT